MSRTTAPALIRASSFHSGRHLDETQLEAREDVCPLCLSGMTRAPVLRLQSDPEVELLSCEECGGYSASRMPTLEALRAYYRGYYDDSAEKVTFDGPSRLARHIFRRAFAGPLPNRQIQILDFGGGDGDVAKRIARLLLGAGASSVHILLVDYNTEIQPAESTRISLERVETLGEAEKGAFDLVVASAILEHIPSPRKDLIQLLAALRIGGVFYARTPSVVPLMTLSRRFGVHWDFTYPGHVHDLGQKFWNTILTRLPNEDTIEVLDSRPALVETTLRIHPLRTIAAHTLKAPWYWLGSSWKLIGGWEAFFRRRGSQQGEVPKAESGS